MNKRDTIIESVKSIIKIINKNINEGITDKRDENDAESSKKRLHIWRDRWEEVENLVKKANEAYSKDYVENLIRENKTRVLYPKRSTGASYEEGTLVKYLDNFYVQIRTSKGGLVRRFLRRVATEDLLNRKYKDGFDALEDWLSPDRCYVPGKFYFAVWKAYQDSKIPRTWQKYI